MTLCLKMARGAAYCEVSPDGSGPAAGTDGGSGHMGRDDQAGDHEAAARHVLSLVPGAPAACGACAGPVIATSYLLDVWTWWVKKLAVAMGVTGLSKSQDSVKAAELDELVDSFRSGGWIGAYTVLWIDALTKVREGGRTVSLHCLVATGGNAVGHREILGVGVTSCENGAGGWRYCAAGLPAACPRSPW